MGSPAYNWLDALRQARKSQRAARPAQFLDRPQSNAQWFDKSPAPYPAYPAPGAAAIDVLALTIPAGLNAIIRQLAIVHVGGNFVDGSGNIVWRVKVNRAGLRGYSDIQGQVGQMNMPVETYIPLVEGDVIEVTAEVPAAQPAMPAGTTTAARLVGWYYPATYTEETHAA